MPERALHKPLVAGLTGSIGMGKSETAKMFARLGVPVHDADATVHALYQASGSAVPPIAASFPEAVVEGQVDRARLAQLIRRDEDSLSAWKRSCILLWYGSAKLLPMRPQRRKAGCARYSAAFGRATGTSMPSSFPATSEIQRAWQPRVAV